MQGLQTYLSRYRRFVKELSYLSQLFLFNLKYTLLVCLLLVFSCCCTILYELIFTVEDPTIPCITSLYHFSCSLLYEHHLLVYSGHSPAWFPRWIYHSTIIMATIRFSNLHQALTPSTYGKDTLSITFDMSLFVHLFWWMKPLHIMYKMKVFTVLKHKILSFVIMKIARYSHPPKRCMK